MSDEYYSRNYRALPDYKVVGKDVAYSGETLKTEVVANFAALSALEGVDPGVARLFAEKFAREVSEKLNSAYELGWADGIRVVSSDWAANA